MSPNTSRTIVLVAGAFMLAAIALRRDQIGDPFRYAWAAGVITLGLSLLSDIAPEIAGPFAILVLMAVYWRNRGVIGSVLPTKANTLRSVLIHASSTISLTGPHAPNCWPALALTSRQETPTKLPSVSSVTPRYGSTSIASEPGCRTCPLSDSGLMQAPDCSDCTHICVEPFHHVSRICVAKWLPDPHISSEMLKHAIDFV